MKIELDYIEKLVKLLSDNDLTELTLEDGEKAVIIKKEKEVVATQIAPVAAPVQAAAPSVAVTEAPKLEVKEVTKGVPITSPMVGTFYRAPSPGAPSFTDTGKTVSVGQIVCIIEAMKLMNEIESDVSGKVVEICVQDGQPVEYGQVLMIVEP
ncbi:MAG: acetyl-CoA carboxylase biotin carboxyl carrier protein [Candidatus Gastranaerophilales bacterium]|nr:acetyl-CoA carboxylase biotin carboxyl carrier protein [Candidatus Gastranaerophilales bacterium]